MDAGSVFAIIVLVTFVPLAILTAVLFYIRSEYQPIKARLPPLVLITDVILILFVICLCAQRLATSTYPCLLNLWASYLGTIFLLNTYCVRCWSLYVNHSYTQHLLDTDVHKDSDDTVLAPRKSVFAPRVSVIFRQSSTAGMNWARLRKTTELKFLFAYKTILTLILLIPCVVLSGTESSISLNHGDVSDGCDQYWGPTVLAVYVGIYVLIFLFFTYSLRQVVDGFFIKEELAFTGIAGLIAAVPWYVFNQVYPSINSQVFPFSTLSLIVACCFAFYWSTVLPLYRSYQNIKVIDAPEDISTLNTLLGFEEGFRSFKAFLTREFSVENLLFWDEVRQYRILFEKNPMDLTLTEKAQDIYGKYIIKGAPLEVNLPFHISDKLHIDLLELFHAVQSPEISSSHATYRSNMPYSFSKMTRPSEAITPSQNHQVVSTVFDDAYKSIYTLMETDSYRRYKGSDLYTDLLEQYEKDKRKKNVLLQMDML